MDFDHGPTSLFKDFGILTENSVLKEGLIYLFTFQFFTPKCAFLNLKMSIWIDPINSSVPLKAQPCLSCSKCKQKNKR